MSVAHQALPLGVTWHLQGTGHRYRTTGPTPALKLTGLSSEEEARRPQATRASEAAVSFPRVCMRQAPLGAVCRWRLVISLILLTHPSGSPSHMSMSAGPRLPQGHPATSRDDNCAPCGPGCPQHLIVLSLLPTQVICQTAATPLLARTLPGPGQGPQQRQTPVGRQCRPSSLAPCGPPCLQTSAPA